MTVLQTKLTAATTKINEYSAAVAATEAALSARDLAIEELRLVISQLGHYVENVSEGEEDIILTANVPVKAPPGSVFMSQVQDLRLTASDEVGEVFADWKRVPGAKNYRVQVSTDTSSPPSNWTEKLTTPKSKCSLNHDLVSGTKVWVRVKAQGPNDDGPWSDPAWKTVP